MTQFVSTSMTQFVAPFPEMTLATTPAAPMPAQLSADAAPWGANHAATSLPNFPAPMPTLLRPPGLPSPVQGLAAKSRVVMPPPLSLNLGPLGGDSSHNARGNSGFESISKFHDLANNSFGFDPYFFDSCSPQGCASLPGMDATANCYKQSAVTERDIGDHGQEKNRLIELLAQFVSAKASSGSTGQHTASDLNVGTAQYPETSAPPVASVANDSGVDMMPSQPAARHSSLESHGNIMKESSETEAVLLVAYIPRSAAPSAVQDVFSRFGTVDKFHLVKDKHGQSKCYGFMYFQTMNAAESAVKDCKSGSVIMHDETGKAWYVKASWANRKPSTRTKNWNRAQRGE